MSKQTRPPRRPISKKKPYSLPWLREKEIYYFCLQYNDWKKRLSSIQFNGSHDEWSDPTGEEAVTRVMCERNMKIVEDACKMVYPEEWKLLLKGVTDQKVTWDNLKLMYDFKCGKNRYYEYKHMVYYLVSQKDRV